MNDIELSEDKFGIKFIKKIGQGSFSTVYQAYDQLNQEFIAIKKIQKSLLQAVKLEQTIMQQLKHNNILQFKKFWKTKDSVYLVMELMKAGSLRQFISFRKKSNKPISEEEVSQIMKYMLSAVEYMHSKNIIHRDLKPENILMNDFEQLQTIKIGDFGLSLQIEKDSIFHKTVSERCGTYIYMAPEQIKKYQYSKPADIWSCGIILYMLLTLGKHPYPQAMNSKEEYAEYIQASPTFEMPENLSKQKNNFVQKILRIGQDLLLRLICTNPFQRYSAGQALIHPWITRCFTDEIPMNIEERILMFQRQVKFSEVEIIIKKNIFQLIKLVMLILFIKKKLQNNQEFIRQYKEDIIISPGKKVQQIKFQNKIFLNLAKSSSPQIIRKKNSSQFHFNLIKIQKERDISQKQHQSMHENYYTTKPLHTQAHSQEKSVSKSSVYCQSIIDQYIEQKSLKTHVKLPIIQLKKIN